MEPAQRCGYQSCVVLFAEPSEALQCVECWLVPETLPIVVKQKGTGLESGAFLIVERNTPSLLVLRSVATET